MIEINGKKYRDNERVDWETAEREAGFLFSRARYLGCHEPPACYVFQPDEPTEQQWQIIGQWYGHFKDREADEITSMMRDH